jgi:hypothetical protein
MILSSIFGKTKPINFVLLIIYLLLVFVVTAFSGLRVFNGSHSIESHALVLTTICMAVFWVEFISKRNNLSSNNNFVIFNFITLMALCPALFFYPKVAVAVWFIILAIRKMITLKSQIGIKRKIFDAALWIGVATLCYNWSLLMLIPLYVAIAIYAGKSFKNLLIPFIALGTVFILCYTAFLLFDQQAQFEVLLSFNIHLQNRFLTESYFWIPTSVFTLLILAAISIFFVKIKSKTTSVKNSLLIVLLALFAVLIAVVLGHKLEGASYTLLVFPMAVYAGNYVEAISKKWIRETILWIFLLLPFINLVV